MRKAVLYSQVETCVLSQAEINHLRLLLGWMRCQYMMDENMQAGYLESLEKVKADGIEISAEAMARHQVTIDRYNNLPAYVKQAIKMLSKSIKKHAPDVMDVAATDKTPLTIALADAPNAIHVPTAQENDESGRRIGV